MTFLCLRRGVSSQNGNFRVHQSFSLPTQRCFRRASGVPWDLCLFSAYAEVFPRSSRSGGVCRSFLCIRRGVSSILKEVTGLTLFSLPTQRCFPKLPRWVYPGILFSAYAEVFPEILTSRERLKSFLCLRRGVSWARVYRDRSCFFSLPTQRCFCSDGV